MTIEPFKHTLADRRLELSRAQTKTLQINVGLLCNQRCKHCHLNAGPDRKENMGSETMGEVISYAQRCHFETIDITGGAPELNANLLSLIDEITPFAKKVMLRSNLYVLSDSKSGHLMDFLKDRHVVIIASFPSINESQADSQRGAGSFQKSIDALKKLNGMGYGQNGSDLELNLVCNPTGAFLPASQDQTEKRFRQVLKKKWGIVFSNLFNFANVPVGRFRQWLIHSGNLESYIEKLASAFNHCAVEALMCRRLVSVSWDGYLYDCDFNLAVELHLGGCKTHVSEMPGPPQPGSPIAVSDHCYTCTAGAGFT